VYETSNVQTTLRVFTDKDSAEYYSYMLNIIYNNQPVIIKSTLLQ
jgi:hypothetical protein